MTEQQKDHTQDDIRKRLDKCEGAIAEIQEVVQRIYERVQRFLGDGEQIQIGGPRDE
jgi:hypothetical protein